MNYDTLHFESGECTEGWYEGSLMTEKEEANGILRDGRNQNVNLHNLV